MPIYPPDDPFFINAELFGIPIVIRWYGIIIVTAAVVAGWFAARRAQQRGGGDEAEQRAVAHRGKQGRMFIRLVAGVGGGRRAQNCLLHLIAGGGVAGPDWTAAAARGPATPL